ncbi:efflux RND transporter periplasmic adaptor subunit [Zhongshania aliphaticivorans]|uniref:efflux RND transporter periplasmic adaptor subunit n=1 Tax=Zhongshania aliphaticivorans TaxID=1470434 RepID=UPI0039C9C5D6
MKQLLITSLMLLGCLLYYPVQAAEDHKYEHDHDHSNNKAVADTDDGNEHDNDQDRHQQSSDDDHQEQGHDESQSTRIKASMAAEVGIKTVPAASARLRQSLIAYGNLSSGPEQLSHVRARYTGLIKSVTSTIGDTVKRGDLLAEVESNESLKTYAMRAPIKGTIIQRHANTGEVTQDQVLFSIANFDTLWAEFRIYPTQRSQVKPEQTVHIDQDGWSFEGVIQHLIPVLDKPYQLARVKLDNQAKGLAPGLLVEGQIVVGEYSVDLAVEKIALQTLGEQRGVFVKNGDEYGFVPLRLGRSDDSYVEVLAGLSPGQDYVSENSYLIKADIEKSEAEHEH